MRHFRIGLIPIFIVLCGCHGAGDWFSDQSHVTCDTSDYISTYVQNSAAQSAQVYFCSSDFAIPQAAQEIEPTADEKYFMTIVRSDVGDKVVPLADSCEDQGYRQHDVGLQVPQMAAADLLKFKICHNPAATRTNGSDSYTIDLYQIINIGEPCPAGFDDFDPAAVKCK